MFILPFPKVQMTLSQLLWWSVVVALVHVQGTFGLALFVAYLTVEDFTLVLVDVSYVNIESVFPWIMSSTVRAREIFVTYKGKYEKPLAVTPCQLCDNCACELAGHQDSWLVLGKLHSEKLCQRSHECLWYVSWEHLFLSIAFHSKGNIALQDLQGKSLKFEASISPSDGRCTCALSAHSDFSPASDRRHSGRFCQRFRECLWRGS